MPHNVKNFYAETPDELLETQRPVVNIILDRFREIIAVVDVSPDTSSATVRMLPGHRSNVLEPGYDQPAPRINEWNTIDFARPHQAFTIDGARGSGKTYVLLTLANAITTISDRWFAYRRGSADSASDNSWTARFKEYGPPRPTRFTDLAMIARIIIPSDMERQECVMERIFDFMTEKIRKTRQWHIDNRLGHSRGTQVKRLDDLQKDLQESIMPGWHFARETGREIIIRDAVDYNDYINRFEQELHKAVEKIDEWRDFLVKSLDAFGTATLAVFLDDSDVHPWIIQDILHTSRMYLNHPS